MNYNEYQQEALRTIKPHASKTEAYADWTMGLMGEIAEVQEVLLTTLWTPDKLMELAKEAGDVIWYLTALQNEFGVLFPCSDLLSEWNKETFIGINNFAHLLMAGGRVSELVKHYTMHKEEIDWGKLSCAMYDVAKHLNGLLKEYNISLETAARLNASKLNHRYNLSTGGTYNTVDSSNRRSKENDFKSTQIYKYLYKEITGGNINAQV